MILLTGTPDPDLLADLDPLLVGRSETAGVPSRLPRTGCGTKRELGDRRGTQRGLGNAGLRGEPDVERLWDAVSTAMRLDAPTRCRPGVLTPTNSRRERQAHEPRLRRDSLPRHGTDLTVGLIPESRWQCATFTTAAGIEHIPNMPTEEIFDARLAPYRRPCPVDLHCSLPPERASLTSRSDSKGQDRRGERVGRRRSFGSSSPSTHKPDIWARLLSSTARRQSSERDSCSSTRSSTRTRPATSLTAPESDSDLRRPVAPTSFSRAGSTSPGAHGFHDRWRERRGGRPRRERPRDADHPLGRTSGSWRNGLARPRASGGARCLTPGHGTMRVSGT